MADTHDNFEATEKAVETFNERNVECVLHAGDLVSPFVVSKLSDLDAELHYVWGNNEGDKLHILRKFKEIGIEPAGNFESLEINDRNIALLHGVNEEIVNALAESGRYDVVVRGHTHEPIIKNNPLVVNPGAVSGYLAEEKTIGLLDLEEMKAEIIKI